MENTVFDTDFEPTDKVVMYQCGEMVYDGFAKDIPGDMKRMSYD